MSLLLVTHERFADHQPGAGHPERPTRMGAVTDAASGELADAVRKVPARPATREELVRVHDRTVVDLVEELAQAGGGRIDADTALSAASFEAGRLAAGAGLEAIERLDADGGRELDAAFCAIRPPGHHATPTRSMGFCLFNNVAIAAATLAERGERVAVVDIDAHHGNGTQDAFWNDERVLYVSLHQYPWYPGTGAIGERGGGPGAGLTINFPFPAHTGGDAYRAAIDRVIIAQLEAFGPTWLLVSAGFDAHRADPLAGLALTAADFADVVGQLVATVPAGRRLLFLEGGYDLAALRDSAAATIGALTGVAVRPEEPSHGGPGAEVVDLVEAELERPARA